MTSFCDTRKYNVVYVKTYHITLNVTVSDAYEIREPDSSWTADRALMQFLHDFLKHSFQFYHPDCNFHSFLFCPTSELYHVALTGDLFSCKF
jgi:hypothetical protein